MPVSRFPEEYAKVKSAMSGTTYSTPIATAMANLAGVLETAGPKTNSGPKIDALRTALKSGNEADNILKGAGLSAGQNVCPTQAAVEKIASIKFMRHMHMMHSVGAQSIWIHTSPKSWRKYIWDEIKDAGGSTASLKTKLSQTEEFFDDTQKARLAEASRLGLTWVQKALVLLAKGKDDTDAAEKVNRWFAPAASDLGSAITTLERGFKKIQGTLNDTQVVITDHPIERGAEAKKYTEAYVMVAAHTPKTIYIEQALSGNFDISVLHDMKKNWARVIVHECTHLDVSTTDEAYAWAGIKPGTKITAAQALKNADSWAFFAADCAGALVAGDITRALNGTGGTVTALPTNWK